MLFSHETAYARLDRCFVLNTCLLDAKTQHSLPKPGRKSFFLKQGNFNCYAEKQVEFHAIKSHRDTGFPTTACNYVTVHPVQQKEA